MASRRPPQPRLAEAAYRNWARSVLALWSNAALALLERSRTELVTRADIERTWDGLLESAGLGAVMVRVAGSVNQANASYFRSILKRVPPAYDTRSVRQAWFAENVQLWHKLGAELADRLSAALAQPRADAGERPNARAINAARKRNVGLVGDLNVKQTLELGRMLKANQEQGVRHEQLIDQVKQITGFGEFRARLIARDQTVKYNASVRQAQARAAGITQYRWVCVRDEATRPWHKRLDGRVFRYDDPPVTNPQGDRNNPGEDYQCRCQDEPVIELFAGLSDG